LEIAVRIIVGSVIRSWVSIDIIVGFVIGAWPYILRSGLLDISSYLCGWMCQFGHCYVDSAVV
jgi:hypothetical protein